MANEFTELIDEITQLSTTLGNYANDVGAYLFNQNNPLPHFSEVIGNIKFDQLVTTANKLADKSTTLSSGAVSQNLYKATGILREASLRMTTKSAMYQRAQLELGNYAREEPGNIGTSLNRIRGSSPEQDVGV